jgi:GTP-binding protein EngB required for normal cell division
MDDKILEMLVNLMEGQTEIKSEIKGLNTRIDKIDLSQEVIINKLDIIAEVQTAHKEQNERAFDGTNEAMEENISLLGTAIKSVSMDVKDVKESVEVMKDVLGHHQIDIEILKRRPV